MYRKNGGDGHFNPAVTTAEVMSGRTTTWFGILYIIFQCIGAKLGVCFANWLLGASLPVISSDSVTATEIVVKLYYPRLKKNFKIFRILLSAYPNSLPLVLWSGSGFSSTPTLPPTTGNKNSSDSALA